MGKRIELENRTRSVLRFPAIQKVQQGKRTAIVLDRKGGLVLGDSADKTLPPGVERGPRCPSPVWVGDEDELKAGLADPAWKQLQARIGAGEIQRRELAA